MNIQPSHLLFFCGLCTYIIIRVIFHRRGAAEKKTITKTNASELLLLVLITLGQIGLPVIFLLTPWLDRANYALPQGTLWIGAPLMAAGLWLFWRSHADLGNSWSFTLELGDKHRLVTQGVYRFVRHPMYASFFVLGASQGLLLNNWLAGWAALVTVTLLYTIRVPHEERMMLEFFGDEYRTYMQRTGGVIPRLQGAGDA